ncbi:MAG: hypothetical protein ACK5ZJ_17695 [Acidobacteriota bacterium]|jgi:hypothetical protein
MTHLIRALWALSDAAGQAAVWLIDRQAQAAREDDTPAYLGIEAVFAVIGWVLVLVVYVVIF